VGDEYDGDNVIVFSPNQIKSAIGNSGAFSKATNDIRGSGALPMLAGMSAAGVGGVTGYAAYKANQKKAGK